MLRSRRWFRGGPRWAGVPMPTPHWVFPHRSLVRERLQHPHSCLQGPSTLLSHVLFTSPSTSFQAIHVSPIVHPPPSPRFSTGALPRGGWAVPRDSSDCYDLEGGALLCLVHRGQGHHYTPFAAQGSPSQQWARPLSQPRVSMCQGGETHP